MEDGNYKVLVRIHKYDSDNYIDIGIVTGKTIDELGNNKVLLYKDYCKKNNLDNSEYFIDNCIWLEWPEKRYQLDIYNIELLVNDLPESNKKTQLVNYLDNIQYFNKDTVKHYIDYDNMYGYNKTITNNINLETGN